MERQRFDEARRRVVEAGIGEPCSWLGENAELLPGEGTALDVACAAGRHALLLAAAGLTVRAVDRDPARIASLRETAGRLGLAVDARVMDLEAGTVRLGRAAYDLVLVIHYLHRPLFPALRDALRPGGLLLYETFTAAQAARGRPTNPRFLLQPGELRWLTAGLEALSQREGVFEGRSVAGVAARKGRPAIG